MNNEELAKMIVEDEFGVEIDVSHKRGLTPDARKVYYGLLRSAGYSYARAGASLNIAKKDHATVMYAVGILNNLIDTDSEFKHRYESCKERFDKSFDTDYLMTYKELMSKYKQCKERIKD